MFDALPGFWTPVLPASELRDRPLGTVVAGERVVFFRTGEGVGAMIDRCPHRGVALSLGKVVDGRLECPFHGWRFDAEGRAEHIPFNPGVTRRCSGALPARELGGLLWLYTGTEAAGEPVVPPALLRPGVHVGVIHEEWACHWTRAMENMLDSPHLPWVHRGTIGAAMAKALTPTSKMTQELVDTDFGFEIHARIDDREPSQLNWRRPNGMELFILDDGKRLVRMHAWCIPTTTDHTRMLVASALDFGPIARPFLGLSTSYNRRILGEDKAVVESSDPVRVPPPDQELNVPTDRPTLRFRAWYHQHLDHLEPKGQPLRAAG